MNKIQMAIVAGVGFLIAVAIATASVFVYSIYQGYQFDYANHKAMVQIIQYNLREGKLSPVPPPVTAPVSAPAASEPKK